jgi:methionine aminopeptidase
MQAKFLAFGRFDVGGRYRHYRADIARIAVLGEPSDKIKTYHHALHMGVRRGIELLRPGVRAARIFEAVVETVRREGIPFTTAFHVGDTLEGSDRLRAVAPSAEPIVSGHDPLVIQLYPPPGPDLVLIAVRLDLASKSRA